MGEDGRAGSAPSLRRSRAGSGPRAVGMRASGMRVVAGIRAADGGADGRRGERATTVTRESGSPLLPGRAAARRESGRG